MCGFYLKMCHLKFTMGLATREHESRPMWILSGLAMSRCIYRLKCRSRFTSVLCVAFEDAMLTQCDFYSILKHDAIHACPLLVHTCTYALIVIFKSTAHAV